MRYENGRPSSALSWRLPGDITDAEADAVITDPPYGVTSLDWDKTATGWLSLIRATHAMVLRLAAILHGPTVRGLDIRARDRLGEAQWLYLPRRPIQARPRTRGAVLSRGLGKRLQGSRKDSGRHSAALFAARLALPIRAISRDGSYESHDGGPRLMRSVIYAKSCHGYAVHPTQKPVYVLTPLIEYSVPPYGTVLDPFGGSFSTGVAALKKWASVYRHRKRRGAIRGRHWQSSGLHRPGGITRMMCFQSDASDD